MPRKKLPYKEGDWFVVPLPAGGFVLGLAARVDGGGGVLGYFFGPVADSANKLVITHEVSPASAALCAMFGDPGLLSGEWPVLRSSNPWRREDGPVPLFGHRDIGNPQMAAIRRYGEDDLWIVEEQRVAASQIVDIPEDGLHGYISLQVTLEQVFRAGSQGHSSTAIPAPRTPLPVDHARPESD